MIKTLDKLRGHRTFLLAALLLIPFAVKGLFFAEGEALTDILQFIGQMGRDVFIGLGASKVGDAAYKYTSRSDRGRIRDRRMSINEDTDAPCREEFGEPEADYYRGAYGGSATPDTPD